MLQDTVAVGMLLVAVVGMLLVAIVGMLLVAVVGMLLVAVVGMLLVAVVGMMLLLLYHGLKCCNAILLRCFMSTNENSTCCWCATTSKSM